MNPSLPALFEVLRRTLREVVEPELTSDHASSQIAGALDILGKLEGMLAWSPDALREQLDLLGQCARDLRALAPGAPELDVDRGVAFDPGTTQASLQQAVERGEAHLRTLIDWLFDQEASLPRATFTELDARIQRTLRQLLVIERKLIPRADFGSMTAGASRHRPPSGGT